MKRSKKYRQILEKIDKKALYSPGEALRLLKQNTTANFDQTVEVHIRLGIDPKKSDQQVRGTVTFPQGTGKAVRIAVFAQGEKVREAQEAGADIVGAEDLVQKIQQGWADFNAAVATPDMMSSVGKLGKILGPKGLMPNPKSGTVTFEVAKAVRDLKRGKIEYRVDKFGIIHLVLGKISFSEEALLENYLTLLNEIIRAKPAAAKGRYIRSITLTTTMSPGIKVDPTKTRELLREAV